MTCQPADATPHGHTPNELARLLRVAPAKVRGWIASGELAAVNTANLGGKPRWVIRPDHLAEFERRRQAVPTPARPRSKRRQQPAGWVDYY
jgi:hypothetical protein